MILVIISSAVAFSQVLAISGASTGLVAMVEGLDVHPLLMVGMMQLVVLFLGCFMDLGAIIMITLPV
ncbi:TRAP transporter large permease subunit, partial [Chloroflexota bacterium]